MWRWLFQPPLSTRGRPTVVEIARMDGTTTDQVANWPSLYLRSFIPTSVVPSIAPKISVMQFNVLADGLSGLRPDKGDFTLTPPRALTWELRRERVLEEIKRCDTDILCLQELDHFDWVAAQLEGLGYTGVFEAKKSSPCLEFSSLEDGCAIFYKTEVFSVVEDVRLSYVDDAERQENQVAILLALDLKRDSGGDGDRGHRILVATTHLKATKNEKGEIIRERQIGQLLARLQTLLHTHRAAAPLKTHTPLVCGDMNSPPHPSPSTGRVYASLLSHPLSLRSAYGSSAAAAEAGAEGAGTGVGGAVGGKDDEVEMDAPYTTWKVRTKGEVRHTIDYIFYPPSNARVLRLLSIPEERDVGAERLPSYRYPSDHLAIAAELELIE